MWKHFQYLSGHAFYYFAYLLNFLPWCPKLLPACLTSHVSVPVRLPQMTFQIFIRLSTNVAKLRFLLYLQTMAPCQVKIQGNLFGVLITAEGADLSTMTKVSWVNETLTNWLHSFAFSNFGKLESFSPKERLPVVSPSVFRYGSFSGVASSQKGRRRFCHRTDGRQVWSLTQSYSVDSSQSRISVKKCVFSKRTIKVSFSCC